MTAEELVARRAYVLRHESSHLAMATVLGRPVHGAYVLPKRTATGWVYYDGAIFVPAPQPDVQDLREYALVLLAGPLADGPDDWPTDWRYLYAGGARYGNDELELRTVVSALDLDRRGYYELIQEALDIWCLPEHGRLEHAFALALELCGSLGKRDLDRVAAVVRAHKEEADGSAPRLGRADIEAMATHNFPQQPQESANAC